MAQEFILKGARCAIPFDHGTAGWMVYDSLLENQELPDALINAKTKQKQSYKELFNTTCRLVQSLQNSGYGKDTVMSLCSEGSETYLQVVIAALYVGAISSPLNENYTPKELEHLLTIARPRLVFCSKATLEKISALQKKHPFIEKLVLLDSDVDGIESLSQFVERHCDPNFDPQGFKPALFDPVEQTALLLCSSGTTGMPKCVQLTHRNLAVRFAHVKDPQWGTQTEPGVTVLNFMPLYHAFGLLTSLNYLWLGLRLVQMAKYEPGLFLQSIQDYKVRSILVVPPILVFLAKSPLVDNYDLSSLEELGSSAGAAEKELLEDVMKRLINVKQVKQAYGLTEATSGIILNSSLAESCGKVVPFMSVKFVDIKTGRTLGPKQNGELCCRGPMVMKGYYGNPAATKEAIDEQGWLHTGDIGYCDENEGIYVVDRLKDLIKYKGFQVPPAELEALLAQHPKVKEAAVVGLPNKVAGELPLAFVVKKPGVEVAEKEIVDYIAGLVSAPKHLRGGVRFIDALPRNATGKVLRKVLRDMIHQEETSV